MTAELQAVADWLQAGRMETVVMESPGVYGIPLGPLLDAPGLAVHRGNARHAPHGPGRHTTIAAGQWRPTLPTFGRLNGSGRPPDDRCVFRASVPPREPLSRAAATGIQPRHTALTAMNGPLANGLRDMSGVTGWTSCPALLAGERAPVKRAACHAYRSHAPPHPLANRRAGSWRAAVLFTLRHSRERYHVDPQPIAAGAAHLHTVASTLEVPPSPAPTSTPRPQNARRHEPHFEVRTARSRISGVALSWGPPIAACEPAWARPKPSPRWPTNSPRWSTAGSNLANQMPTRAGRMMKPDSATTGSRGSPARPVH